MCLKGRDTLGKSIGGNLSIGAKIMGATFVVFGVLLVVLLSFLKLSTESNIIEMSIAKSKKDIEKFRSLRGYYTANIVKVVKGFAGYGEDQKISPMIEHHGNPKGIPLPATMIQDLSKIYDEQGGSQLKLYSDHPFKDGSSRPLDDFQERAMAYFRQFDKEGMTPMAFFAKNPEKASFSSVEEKDGKRVSRVAVPDFMTKPMCVDCHNRVHPVKNNSSLQSHLGRDEWKLGDTRGVLEMVSPLDDELAAASHTVNFVAGIVIVGFVICLLLLWYLIRRALAPSSLIIDGLKSIAEGRGDLTQRLEVRSGDEMGQISHWVNETLANVQALISKVKLQVSTLETQTSALREQSKLSQVEIDGSVEQSDVVYEATQKLHLNIDSMASAVEEISINVTGVSQSSVHMAEGMSDSMQKMESLVETTQEIGAHSQQGSKVSQEAHDLVTHSSESINQLGESAKEIGQVTEMIKRIAEQTNLLALNATIEAASAGESGKGFAVVASEIKELASQSGKAAEGIHAKIDDVQSQTHVVIETFEKVAGVIKAIDASVGEISQSVEKQNEVTKSVVETLEGAHQVVDSVNKSIKEAAIGVNDISEHAGEAAVRSDEVNESMSKVQAGGVKIRAAASQTMETSNEIQKAMSELKSLVEHFKV